MNIYILDRVWSENKYINTLINVLVFLLSINLFHYGQLLLPIICFVILLDRKFVFRVNNLKIFILLILFSIFFFLFSYKSGIYSVMGFCLPMSYYIGSNYKAHNKNDIVNIILLIVAGMICHFLLNAIYEISRFGIWGFLSKVNRYDIWTRSSMASTATATNTIILFSCIYYFVFKESNKVKRFVVILFFILTFFYVFVLRRRTPIVILVVTFFVEFLYDFLYEKSLNKNKIVKFIAFVLTSLLAAIVAYFVNLFGFKDYIDGFSLIKILEFDGFKSGRIDILINGIKYVPNYMFGGTKISSITGNVFHDLLFDIYDYAGIIPFLLMIVTLFLMAYKLIHITRNKRVDGDIRILILGVFVGISLMLCVEPIMTGSSLFLIVSIMLYGVIEKI